MNLHNIIFGAGGLSSVVIVVKEVIVVKVICFVDSYHNFLYRGLSSVVKEVIVVKVICFVGSHHNFLYRGLSSVVIVVKEVIVVKVICFVASCHNFIITTFAIVPADLRSAGIEYQDFSIRLNYRCLTRR